MIPFRTNCPRADFLAVKRHRDVDLGGPIRLCPSLAPGRAVIAVAGVIVSPVSAFLLLNSRFMPARSRPAPAPARAIFPLIAPSPLRYGDRNVAGWSHGANVEMLVWRLQGGGRG